nr:unnamed protein product [Callosobruchus analis]
MMIDDFLFEPCGYSMNGVTKNGCYMTIHITQNLIFRMLVLRQTFLPALIEKLSRKYWIHLILENSPLLFSPIRHHLQKTRQKSCYS